MTAAIYRTSIRHVRRDPLKNAFTYRSYSWFVDVDDLPRCPAGCAPLAGFHAKDHLGDPAAQHPRERGPLPRRATAKSPTAARSPMLANARVLGHVFNPISLFWCHGADGGLRAVIAEVHNTYGERHCYLLHPDDAGRARTDKEFYVSPFNEVDGSYRMSLPEPAAGLAVAVVLERAGRKPFTATMTGVRRPATAGSILAAALAVPLAPLRLVAADPLARNQTLGPRAAHHQPSPPPITGGRLMTLTDPHLPYGIQRDPAALRVPPAPAAIDAEVWPGVARPPAGAKAPVAGKAADSLFRAPPAGCRCGSNTPTARCWAPAVPARR